MNKDVTSRIQELEASTRELQKQIDTSRMNARHEANEKLRKAWKVPCRGPHRWPKYLLREQARLQEEAMVSRKPQIEKWTRKINAQRELLARLCTRL